MHGLMLLGSPFAAFFIVRQFITGRASPWIVMETVSVIAMAVLLQKKLPHRVRRIAALACGLVLATGALLQFGPRLGTGVFFAAAVVLGA